MENKVKKCKQCGEYRNIEEYRLYYNKTKKQSNARYTICRTCEAINQRHKYLNTKLNKGNATDADRTELDQIEELYDVLREAGLQPPTKRVDMVSSVAESISDILAKRRADLERREEVNVELDTPDELVEWLSKDLSNYHPDELEKVSDRLWTTYRPQVGLDDNYKPIFDDTHRETLDKIQERFDEHEDNYAW